MVQSPEYTSSAVDSTDKVTLGLDIGGTNIKAIALQWPGKILKQLQRPSNAGESPIAVRKAIENCLSEFRESLIFSSIGIGCAGSVDHEAGIVRNSPNFAKWRDVPLRKWVEEDSQLPTTLDNDANCAVLAEWKLGCARGLRNVVLLTLGTGIGGGLIIHNEVYRGSTGSAAELGHFSIHADGIGCPCGNRGCFERYCSASALKEKLPGLSTKEIFERFQEEPFRSIISKFIEELQISVTSLANIFDPDAIIFGGAVSMGVTKYLGEVQNFVRHHAFPGVRDRVRLLTTTFGHQSGAVGAALLC